MERTIPLKWWWSTFLSYTVEITIHNMVQRWTTTCPEAPLGCAVGGCGAQFRNLHRTFTWLEDMEVSVQSLTIEGLHFWLESQKSSWEFDCFDYELGPSMLHIFLGSNSFSLCLYSQFLTSLLVNGRGTQNWGLPPLTKNSRLLLVDLCVFFKPSLSAVPVCNVASTVHLCISVWRCMITYI